MKPILIFTGTVSRSAERETPPKGNPYVAFTLESPDAFNKFPNRVRCMVYGTRADDAMRDATEGALLSVVGSAAARGYEGRDKTPKAALCCYVNELTVHSERAGRSQSQPRDDGQHADAAADARKEWSGKDGATTGAQASATQSPNAGNAAGPGSDGDDLPF